jgi:antitoxin component of RelBE/YafQ-DinJ toxin-antitoxin module
MVRFELRMDEETAAMLDALAAELGLSRAGVVKMLVREAARKRGQK